MDLDIDVSLKRREGISLEYGGLTSTALLKLEQLERKVSYYQQEEVPEKNHLPAERSLSQRNSSGGNYVLTTQLQTYTSKIIL